jgi:hypothetical protein
MNPMAFRSFACFTEGDFASALFQLVAREQAVAARPAAPTNNSRRDCKQLSTGFVRFWRFMYF